MTNPSASPSRSELWERWMDATREWWRSWSTFDRAACSQAQIADMMREAFEAGHNTALSAVSETAKQAPKPDTEYAEVVKFIRYWQGHPQFDGLITEQLHKVAAQAVENAKRASTEPSDMVKALLHMAAEHPDLYDSERFWLREAAAVLTTYSASSSSELKR